LSPLWLGATLVGGGEIEAGSSERARGIIAPRAAVEFEFAVTHKRLVSGTMRFRVFIASRGGFGFVGGILLVPRARWQTGIEDRASLRMSALSERDGR
jgi:hypothetical protein